MRHQRSGKKLGRDSAHRKALYANLAGALIEHGRIKTTVTKAKAVKPIAERMITLGRRGDLHARRQAVAFLRSKDVVHKLFTDVAPRFGDRPGGYSRIIRIGPRPGDAAEMVYLELVDQPLVLKSRLRAEEQVTASEDASEPVAVDEPPAEGTEVEEAETDEPEGDEAEEPVSEGTSDDEPAAEAADEPAADEPEPAADEEPPAAPEASAESPADVEPKS